MRPVPVLQGQTAVQGSRFKVQEDSPAFKPFNRYARFNPLKVSLVPVVPLGHVPVAHMIGPAVRKPRPVKSSDRTQGISYEPGASDPLECMSSPSKLQSRRWRTVAFSKVQPLSRMGFSSGCFYNLLAFLMICSPCRSRARHAAKFYLYSAPLARLLRRGRINSVWGKDMIRGGYVYGHLLRALNEFASLIARCGAVDARHAHEIRV